MSDINLDFTVSNNQISFTVEPNEITITPTDIQLTLGSSGGAAPAGNVGQLQYKVSALQLGGVPNTLYDGSNLALGNVANIKITGGTNGYVLQTDGTGNLDWVAQSGGGGNGSPGGSNTQVQYNDNGVFGGNVGFTFNEVTGVFTAPFHAGNGSSLSSITGANVTGQVGYAAVANSVEGSNVSGQVANSLVAGTVYTAAQPNITSVGTLTSLSLTGTGSVQQMIEKVLPNATPATGTVNFDLNSQAILYYTANASANFTLNFRGNSSLTLDSMLSNNQSITCAFINTNGSTGYYANVIKIDSTTITPKWVYPGAITSGTVNGQDVYTFNIIKTATNTYSVFASKIGYV